MADNRADEEIITGKKDPGEEPVPLPNPEALAHELAAALEETASTGVKQSKSDAPEHSMLEKKYPAPAELVQKAPVQKPVPTKINLADIGLPSYMTGGASRDTQKKVTAPSQAERVAPDISRSAREIGLSGSEKISRTPRSTAPNNELLGKDGLPVVRTYARDLNQEMQKRGATLSTIVGAERERAAQEKIPPQKTRTIDTKKILLWGISLLLVVLAFGAIGAALFFSREPEPTETPHVGLVRSNTLVPVTFAPDENLRLLLNQKRQEVSLPLGEVAELLVVRDRTAVSPEEILRALGAPSPLARNATGIMVGLHSFDRNQPFIIVTTSFYDLSFDAMLSWEKSIAESLDPLFRPNSGAVAPPSLSFSDIIYKNIDVRESSSLWPILYAFPSKDTLIITTNRNTLSEILTRIATAPAR